MIRPVGYAIYCRDTDSFFYNIRSPEGFFQFGQNLSFAKVFTADVPGQALSEALEIASSLRRLGHDVFAVAIML